MSGVLDHTPFKAPRDSPERFKKIYLLLAFSCLIVILAVSLTIISYHSSQDLLKNAELDSLKIADALLASEKHTILISANNYSSALTIAPNAVPALDVRLRAFLHPLNIVKIKIYSSDKRIIYCTEQKLIGKVDSENRRLIKALGGAREVFLKESQTITDLVDEKRLDVDVAEVYVPVLNSGGRVVGVFEIYNDVSKVKAIFKSHLYYSSVALVCSILLISFVSYLVIIRASNNLRQAYHLLETMATIDSLTGVFNRRQLLNRGEDLFTMTMRSHEKVADGVGLGFIMIDIDHFKQVNDVYGHLTGDEVLRALAKRVVAVLRPYDVFGRYGGEEFLLIVPNMTKQELVRVAERLLDVVRDKPFQVGELNLQMTISVGCTWTNADSESFNNVLMRADELMYEAKQQGRNQMVFHD